MRQLEICPACSADGIRFIWTGNTTRNPSDPNEWQLSDCIECGHAFLNPQPDWNELAPYYHDGYQPYDTDHGVQENIPHAIEIAKTTGEYRHVRLVPGVRVLDVGSGGGSFLQVARGVGALAMGIEPSKTAAERSQRNGLDVFNGTLEEYVAGEFGKQFDLITFSHVVEHLPDPVTTLSLAARLVGPGGIVWIAVPNGGCRSAKILKWKWHSSDLPLHLQHFTLKSLTIAAKRAGLNVRRIYTYSLPTAIRASLIHELRYRFLVPQKLGASIVRNWCVNRLAKRMDMQSSGEAILVELSPK